MSLAPGERVGKYVVRRKLAEGGMAEIYLATVRGPEGFEKEVAIKRIRPFLATDPEFVRMFISEARVASRLNHANVVQIFDFDKHQDTYYLAMEYVRGLSWSEARKIGKDLLLAMPPTLVAHVASEVARGLHYAHQLTEKGEPLGLVHRDVTPHNVLLAYEGAVKLTDFGIAKAGNKLTSPGMLKGKFAYMSPEQSRGEDVDRRTDVFALGIVLWEMLTGGKLFEGDSDVAVLKAVQQRAIPPPARLNPEVPAELDQVVMRALERDPAARYATAQELERALAGFLLRHRKELEDTDVSAFLKQLGREETTELPAAGEQNPDPADPRHPAATAVMGPARAAEAAHGPPSPDEDPNADTYVLARDGSAEKSASREARPTVPMHGVREAIAEKERTRVSRPALEPTATRVRPTVGMRRAVAAALGLFALGGGAIALYAWRAAPPTPRPLPAPQTPDAFVVVPPPPPPPPVLPDAGEGRDAGPPQSHEAGPGTLVVRATPWAQVIIDGVARDAVYGTKAFRLPPGRHRLRFVHPRGAQDFTVQLESGKTVTREFDAFKP